MAHPSSDNNADDIHPAHPHYVRASDIGSYLYCKRAWWLEQVQGWQPDEATPRRSRGVAAHRTHGCWVWLAQTLMRLAWLGTITVIAIAVLMWLGWWPW